MTTARPEVLIVGGGPAGMAAALRLARAGVVVIVIEGAEFAGAENWSGCVYHADDLLREDVLGRDLWEQAPKERRVVARSLFVHDGQQAVGFEATANANNNYGEAWTVLRPKLDRWIAARAIDFGVTLLPATTVTGLRYDGERVVGVNTQRGPLLADVVFLAEGDAAGLLAREGLEHVNHPHYAQGIKAVFRLDARTIETRFDLEPGTGVAQEWLLRNGQWAGRDVPLNATAFLYTNHDSLSLGLVLPLDRLAQHSVADHPHLLQRVTQMVGIAEYLKDAPQIAYGAKVIRAGGVDETPVWQHDGLAIGGGVLGLGMEFPYPNFIGPAITSGLAFADAVVALRAQPLPYTSMHLEREYAQRLRQTTDYANATLLRRWPRAIHSGGLLFDHIPALLGQLLDANVLAPEQLAAQRQRALAAQLGHLRADLKQGLKMAKGLASAPSDIEQTQVPGLSVRFLSVVANKKPEPLHFASGVSSSNALMESAALAIGHFYGRRVRDMRARLQQVWNALRPRAFPIAGQFALLGWQAGIGSARLLGDLAAYKLRRIPLRELILRPYHQHEDVARTSLEWGQARRTALSPTTWLAPMNRYQPDVRHITLPLEIAPDAAQQLRNVCPAEVYTLTSRWGGADSQYENCIKCESCRVTVPGIDWNRASDHRLSYRVPHDGRYGLDGSVNATISASTLTPIELSATERVAWQKLYHALQARASRVGEGWAAHCQTLLNAVPATPWAQPIIINMRRWLSLRAFGWVENEVKALLTQAQALPRVHHAWRNAPEHARLRRRQHWQRLRKQFSDATLRDLAESHKPHSDATGNGNSAWPRALQQQLLAWINSARHDHYASVEWLAGWSPALAWIAANHYLAEDYAAQPISDTFAAALRGMPDGMSNWAPNTGQYYVDSLGKQLKPVVVGAHGAGLDAARPARFVLAATTDSLLGRTPTPEMAHGALSIALGQAYTLRQRAAAYAQQRVQFRGDIKDREGNDGIIKFGAIKTMLANIEQAVTVLQLARPYCDTEPAKVLALIQTRMGVRMDAVPWLAGQIFGGMAYSEEDIFAPRYRDAMVLGQWPQAADLDHEQVGQFQRQLLAEALDTHSDYCRFKDLQLFTHAHTTTPTLTVPAASGSREISPYTKRGGALTWNNQSKLIYRSGGFINGQTLAGAQLLTPEHFVRDKRLRATRAAVLRLLRSGFRSPQKGMSYGHYIDALHGIPASDVNRLRAFNAFATIVPARLGGKEWGKADYSVLTALTMSLGDTSLSLLIMASTSIGTMPVILGLEKDLPRLRAEVTACLDDTTAWDDMQAHLRTLLQMLVHPEPKSLKALLTDWATHTQHIFMAPGSTLKYLVKDYLLLLQQTVQIAKSRDLDALGKKLQACSKALPQVRAILKEEQAAINLRTDAHERFLRFLGTGQISAFALTEPVAGSDTGGIQTAAVLRTVLVTSDGRGFFRFVPFGNNDPRILLDAANLVFDNREVGYRLPDGSVGILDDSQWNYAQNQGQRVICSGGQGFVFHDIGRVVERGGDFVYSYWEISGSKMWITNGSVADRYCLYAQTEFGETGFMVERRSEGLRIGPNENKLGQRASPTNELTLDKVRVSAEQVIGYRGHGQVNALETLSVGRGGLVNGCATLIERVLLSYASLWQQHPQLQRFAQCELDRLQTLAARLVGLMDSADLQKGDFRIEAALSKYLASEGLHRVLLAFEKIQGPMSAAKEELTEKWRRDARILNIYEGTNEIQRFLVLKDLPQLLAHFAKEKATPIAQNLTLDMALRTFRETIAPRVQVLGARLWQDPDLQVRWFPVVDWVGELYVACALYERLHLLEVNNDTADHITIRRLRNTLQAQFQHIDARAQQVLGEFADSEIAPGEDRVPATINIARLTLAALSNAPPLGSGAMGPVATGPIAVGSLCGSWGVILRSRLEWSDGKLQWAGWHGADMAVLDRLLTWADDCPDLSIRVAVLAPAGVEDRVRRLQAAGAQVLYVKQPLGIMDAADVAAAITHAWTDITRWAFGAVTADNDNTALQIAHLLGVEALSHVTAIGAATRRGIWAELPAASDNPFGLRHFIAAKRGVAFTWDLKPSGRSDCFNIDQWLKCLQQPLAAVVLGEMASPSEFLPLDPPVRASMPQEFETPALLGVWLKQYLGQELAPETSARQTWGTQALEGAVLWLTPASGLRQLQHSAALALINDLKQPNFAVLAWHTAQATQAWPEISAFINQAGLNGVWQMPITPGMPLAANFASAIGAWANKSTYIVLRTREQSLALGLAAQLRLPLLDQVTHIKAERVTCAQAGYLVTRSLPKRAIIVVSDNYHAGALVPAPPAVIRVARLPDMHIKAGALAYWQAQAGQKTAGLASADIVLDIGLGATHSELQQVALPKLTQALAQMSGRAVEIGATRKVTQELKLISAERQIGQTGIAVAPDLLFALGISGAPQHMNWIAKNAVVIAINRDAQAPIFRWQAENGAPHIIRCVGDVDIWVTELIRILTADVTTMPAPMDTGAMREQTL